MKLGKSLIIAKYLIKNYLINPFLKSFRKKHALIAGILVAIVILAAIVIFAIFAPPEPEGGNSSSSASIRKSMIALRLNKYVIIDVVSSALTLIMVFEVIRGRITISVMEEAEYEVLLAQPLDMETYFLGRFVKDTVWMFTFTAWYVSLIPIATDLSKGRSKAVLLPVSIFLMTSYLSALDTLISELKIIWREKKDYLRLTALLYIIISAAHSLLARRISPLISAPFIFLARSIVYCATISESILDVLLSLGGGTFVLILILLAEMKLADRISPEYVKPASILMKEKKFKKRERRKIYSLGSSESVFNYLFRWEIVNRRHIITLALILLATGLPAYILRRFLVAKLGISIETLQFLSLFLIPLLASEALSFLINSSMAKDLAAFWIYRVYARDLKPIARSLMLKYAFYLSEAFLVISVYDAITASPSMILMPLIILPLTILMAFLLLAVVTYLASRRRIIRQAPVGLYMLEELAASLVMVIVISIYMVSDILMKFLLPTIPDIELAVICLVSLVLALILHKILTESLSDLMFSYDVLS